MPPAGLSSKCSITLQLALALSDPPQGTAFPGWWGQSKPRGRVGSPVLTETCGHFADPGTGRPEPSLQGVEKGPGAGTRGWEEALLLPSEAPPVVLRTFPGEEAQEVSAPRKD